MLSLCFCCCFCCLLTSVEHAHLPASFNSTFFHSGIGCWQRQGTVVSLGKEVIVPWESSQRSLQMFWLGVLVVCLFIFDRYRWNNMPRLEKVYLKNNVMGLISSVSTWCPRLFSEMWEQKEKILQLISTEDLNSVLHFIAFSLCVSGCFSAFLCLIRWIAMLPHMAGSYEACITYIRYFFLS